MVSEQGSARGYAFRWKPLEPLAEPSRLAAPELRAFEELWRKQKDRLSRQGVYGTFWERLARRWSIETGIIERVYDVSLGATRVLIEHGFDANLIHHGETDVNPERLIEVLNDHRSGLELVMDMVGGRRDLTPSWIKELHALLCRHQPTVTAREAGPRGRLIEIRFEHGAYKRMPNNPTLPDGSIHEYCPPEHVASEVERMLDLYVALPLNLPEVRSAWLHHAFTQIHPFQDGNGRIARALASIDFIRAGLFPLVVDRSDRDVKYMPALVRADRGDLTPLVQLFAECQERAIVQAVSMADDAIAREGGKQALIEAARAKVASRAATGAAKRHEMAERISGLADDARSAMAGVGKEIEGSVPGVSARTERSTPENAHYWTKQIVDLAKSRGYWADRREPRAWARLQLADGGITDVVVSLHFVGNPSPGTCMSGAFLVHRSRGGESVADATFTLLPQETLVLAAEEDESRQRERFAKWVDETILIALAEWKKQL